MRKRNTIITDYSCIISPLNTAGDDSSVMSKGRSFQQVTAEGKRWLALSSIKVSTLQYKGLYFIVALRSAPSLFTSS